MGNRPGQRQAEKDKQDTSCNSLHTFTMKQVLTGFYNVRSVTEKRPEGWLRKIRLGTGESRSLGSD